MRHKRECAKMIMNGYHKEQEQKNVSVNTCSEILRSLESAGSLANFAHMR